MYPRASVWIQRCPARSCVACRGASPSGEPHATQPKRLNVAANSINKQAKKQLASRTRGKIASRENPLFTYNLPAKTCVKPLKVLGKFGLPLTTHVGWTILKH